MFNTLFYSPLYNALVGITSFIPGHQLALAIIVLTLFVKVILFPISKKAVATQMKIKLIEPEMTAIREKYKDDKQEQARKTLELYKTQNLNPFSTLFLAIIQIPIFIALALMFSKNALATIDPNLLYSFISVPDFINQQFFSLDISQKSIVLGALAGILQFFQIQYSLPALKKVDTTKPQNFKDDLARSMHIQMKFVLPVIVFIASLGFSAAMSIYWIISTLFTLGQEVYFRKTIKKEN